VADDSEAYAIDPLRRARHHPPVKRDRRILQTIGEAEHPRRAPRSAIMDRQNGSSGTPQALRQADILFVTGEAVEQQDRWMRPLTTAV
jgi:hypothetical protein